MYCRAIACDFDGTGATQGRLSPEVAGALHAARHRGIAALLVTGRVLEDLRLALVDFTAFDAIVAENGAVVWFPATDRLLQLAPSPPESFLGQLRASGIPFHTGAVVIGTWEGHAREALDLIRRAGLDFQLVFNRAAVMLLPSGVNKATGVRRALDELHLSPHNMIAFGDAENDLPLFALAEVAVAARGSVPAVAAASDERLALPGASGIAHYVARLLDAGASVPTPDRHGVEIGRTLDGRQAVLPATTDRIVISGDPRSGKSWLAGLLAERLLETGHRLCVVDPEGEHAAIADRPGAMVLGGLVPLPDAAVVPAVLRESRASLVLSLTTLSHGDQCRYVCRLLEGLALERRTSGLPHWTFVDEAHYFFREDAQCCASIISHVGNVVLVTYRPSLLAASVHDAANAHLLTSTAVDSERYFLAQLIASRVSADRTPAELLDEMGSQRAGLILQATEGATWQTLVPADRLSAHTHHSKKYVDTNLPQEKAFRFTLPHGGVVAVAGNVREFADAIVRVPIDSLRQHMKAHDFSRWARDVLGDRGLAAGLGKLEDAAGFGAEPDRTEVLAHLGDRYAL